MTLASRTPRSPTRRAQVFTIDLILGLVITTIAILALTIYTSGKAAPMRSDAESVSVLMTPGVPEQWNATTVVIPGFLTNDRFDQQKIATFANFTETQQRSLLGIHSKHRIRFLSGNTTLPLCLTCGADPVNPGDVLPLRRYGIWNGTIVTMEVTLFR